jgi:type IV fimbrial biogenesis protein FimT
MSKGFTLLELLVTLAVVGVLLSVAVPSMQSAAEKRRTIAAAEELFSQLKMARSQAVARSEPIFMNIVPGANWAVGISNDATCDPSDNLPACTLPDAANNNPITHLFASNDFSDVSLASTSNQITFQSQRGTSTGATIDITSTDNIGYVMTINVGILGQINMCSDDTDTIKHIRAYRAC